MDKLNRNAVWNLNQTASYPLYKQPNSVRRCNFPPYDVTSLAIHVLLGDALRIEQFFKHVSCHPTTQFEDFNHVNADATDETKIVPKKFVLGFCHGQLRFCLLLRISPKLLKKLWCFVGGDYYKLIWFYQLGR